MEEEKEMKRFSNSILLTLLSFVEIGNAYAVLSNADKRRQYDLTGGEEPSSPSHSHGAGFDFHRGFEADITPEDLFNMFFGGGFPSCKCAHQHIRTQMQKELLVIKKNVVVLLNNLFFNWYGFLLMET